MKSVRIKFEWPWWMADRQVKEAIQPKEANKCRKRRKSRKKEKRKQVTHKPGHHVPVDLLPKRFGRQVRRSSVRFQKKIFFVLLFLLLLFCLIFASFFSFRPLFCMIMIIIIIIVIISNSIFFVTNVGSFNIQNHDHHCLLFSNFLQSSASFFFFVFSAFFLYLLFKLAPTCCPASFLFFHLNTCASSTWFFQILLFSLFVLKFPFLLLKLNLLNKPPKTTWPLLFRFSFLSFFDFLFFNVFQPKICMAFALFLFQSLFRSVRVLFRFSISTCLACVKGKRLFTFT